MIKLIIRMLRIAALKNYLTLTILMFFLFNIVGYYLWFSYLKFNIQKEVTQEIRQGTAEKDLTLITVSINDESGICWLKAGKEFTYRGEMFDVVKIKICKDKKYIYCINDTREKKLISDFSRNNEPDQKTKKLVSSFQYIYVIQPATFPHITETSNFDYSIQSFNIVSVDADVNSPPPKFIFAA